MDFFDTNQDGKVTLAETYRGLRRLGIGAVRAALLAAGINGALASTPPWTPSFVVDVQRLPSRMHRSDTGAFDRHGRFSLRRFRRLFAGFDTDGDGALGRADWTQLFVANRQDFLGHLASKAEFGLLLELAGEPRNGELVLTRERLERFYDGSLFYELAEEVAARRASAWGLLKTIVASGMREIY